MINSHMSTKKPVTLRSLSFSDFTSSELHVHQVNFLYQEPLMNAGRSFFDIMDLQRVIGSRRVLLDVKLSIGY